MSPYELVDSEKAAFPVGALCEAVGVSRSAFYTWRRSTPSARKLANDRLLAEIRAIHVENKARYGSPRMRDGRRLHLRLDRQVSQPRACCLGA